MDPVLPPQSASAGLHVDGGWEIHSLRASEIQEVYRTYRSLPPGESALYHPFPTGSVRLWLLLVLLCLGRGILPRLARRAPREAVTLAVSRSREGGELVALGTLNFALRASDGSLAARTGVYVVPAFRRHGAGRTVNEWMLAQARQRGARRAEALILPANTGSRALFESMGYRLRPSGVRDDYPPGDEFLMAERDPA
jgi:GNAT superfamily N-acetyltransferase